MTVYERHADREDWLAHRGGHIGASEAGAVLGVGFQTKIELWEIKTGRATAKDLSDNGAVAYGNRAENALRELFMAKHPEYELVYRPYDFVYQAERDWMRATLDGELHLPNGGTGILEIKTSRPVSRADWSKWRGRVPDGYYAQILHQFAATGFSFAWLFAELTGADGNAELRSYYYDRAECEADMELLIQEEESFWRYVKEDRMPPVPLRL